MDPFKLASIRTRRGVRAAVVVDELAYELPDELSGIPAGSLFALLQRWHLALPMLARLAERKGEGAVDQYPLAQVQFAAPILYPRKLLMAGANYAEHTQEMVGQRADRATQRPYAFLKATEGCVIGFGEAIVRPAGVEQLDWEGELAVVIGRAAKDVPAAKAFDYVAGYTIMNDVTARERTHRGDSVFEYDWYAAKSCDTFGPMGPYLVPREFVPEPENLRLVTTVSGQVMQDSSTKHMIYSIAELIAFLSRAATLAPGDVISTGTPSGVGMGRGIFLEPGDTVAVEIEGLGRLENPVV